MKDLISGPRQSGRTTTLLLTMNEEMGMHDKPVCLIVGNATTGFYCKSYLKKINADTSRIRIVTVNSLYVVRGICPLDVYIEHTAYEFADCTQLNALYRLEEEKDNYVFGDL